MAAAVFTDCMNVEKQPISNHYLRLILVEGNSRTHRKISIDQILHDFMFCKVYYKSIIFGNVRSTSGAFISMVWGEKFTTTTSREFLPGKMPFILIL